MQNRSPSRRLPLFLLPLFLLLAGCAGHYARQEALLPVMREAWPPIQAAAVREAAALSDDAGGAAVVDAGKALDAGTEAAVARVDWARVLRLADGDTIRRALTGEIGPGVAASLNERVARFAESVRVFARLPG